MSLSECPGMSRETQESSVCHCSNPACHARHTHWYPYARNLNIPTKPSLAQEFLKGLPDTNRLGPLGGTFVEERYTLRQRKC